MSKSNNQNVSKDKWAVHGRSEKDPESSLSDKILFFKSLVSFPDVNLSAIKIRNSLLVVLYAYPWNFAISVMVSLSFKGWFSN